ncbi:MAG TPA: carboxypeptidase regulatory-like domain-containing protein [Blastocatellia bacterium]|nr:carboxypeptidase regulatory-like domain-containing protein [Blastocatellia bacterium]
MKFIGHRAMRSIVLVAGFFAITAGVGLAADIQGKVTAQGMRSAAGIVVYVDAQIGGPPSQHVTVDQKKMTFIPHVIAVQKGTTVDFLNSDPVGHNVYWPSVGGNKGLAHNLGTWPQGQTKSFTFHDLGAAPLLCNVHAEMSGYVVVVPSAYHAVTGADGSFVIRGVPPGHYTLKTWSASGKPTVQQVDVGAGGATVALTVTR